MGVGKSQTKAKARSKVTGESQSAPSDGVSVVIPFGGRRRLAMLEATLASLRRCAAVDQVIVAELGGEPVALEAAARWGADHLFIPAAGAFDKVRAVNTGCLLARRAEILWCDADLLFDADFVSRALEEFRTSGLDFLFPFSSIAYIGEAQSREVIAGTRRAADCQPAQVLRPLRGGAPGGMGLVRSDFLRRHGGMIEGFQGWGFEDEAWVHKVSLLGRVGATARRDQRAWHLFHPDSGSHSLDGRHIAVRGNPGFARNAELCARILAVSSADELARRFPPPPHAPPPWPASARIVFVAVASRMAAPAVKRARRWARRLNIAFGVTAPIVCADLAGLPAAVKQLAADVIIGVADDVAGCAALTAVARGHRLILAPDDRGPGAGWPSLDGDLDCWILAPTATQAAEWARQGLPVWGRAWAEGEGWGEHVAPVLVQPLSHMLAAPRTWKIRIMLERAALPPAAMDQPRFWYVGFHDADDAEISREDANRQELQRALVEGGERIQIDREVRSLRRPVRWTVWTANRAGQWLDKLSGPIDAGLMV